MKQRHDGSAGLELCPFVFLLLRSDGWVSCEDLFNVAVS